MAEKFQRTGNLIDLPRSVSSLFKWGKVSNKSSVFYRIGRKLELNIKSTIFGKAPLLGTYQFCKYINRVPYTQRLHKGNIWDRMLGNQIIGPIYIDGQKGNVKAGLLGIKIIGSIFGPLKWLSKQILNNVFENVAKEFKDRIFLCVCENLYLSLSVLVFFFFWIKYNNTNIRFTFK